MHNILYDTLFSEKKMIWNIGMKATMKKPDFTPIVAIIRFHFKGPQKIPLVWISHDPCSEFSCLSITMKR
ncbi:MAG TPA: hypothetical protein DCW31_10595 [Lactobacillus sp.]|nr:hypothetical protein [Lactobacillus sp.]